ncbi:MAG: TRL-like family protein [Bdellovibrionota bacterium]
MHGRSRQVSTAVFTALLLCVVLCGCSHPVGLLYTTVQSPRRATPQPRGSKEGKACSFAVLGLLALGDASVDRARHNGRITKVEAVDKESFFFLAGLYASECTTVRGR